MCVCRRARAWVCALRLCHTAWRARLLGHVQEISLADLFMFVVVDTLVAVGVKPEDISPAYPKLLASVAEHPRIAPYLAARAAAEEAAKAATASA